MGIRLLVGTQKGLFTFKSEDRSKWEWSGPHLKGQEINHATTDPRTGTAYATANNVFYGSRVATSTDGGETWLEPEEGVKFEEGSDRKLERLWHIEPGLASQPETLFAGVAPAALFRSDDSGKTWNEVEGLTSHPTREKWQPGAGGLCLHSICPDPADENRMWVGISAVGAFLTEDGGATWTTKNKGVRAEFQPEKYPEFGQCVHHMLKAPGDGERLYQQNHCGVYRSDDGGDTWGEITEGLPSDFGFGLALHPSDPDVAYVLPLQGAEFRGPPDFKLRVYRTTDAGKSWEALTNGLPQDGAYMGSYREGMCSDTLDPAGIYIGTNTGQVYASADEGDSWERITAELPPVTSLDAGAV